MPSNKTLSYGERVALNLIKKRRNSPTEPKNTTQKKARPAPDLQLYPLNSYEYKHTQDVINWETNAVGEGLANHARDNEANMSMLVLPTGVGKTGATVYALSQLKRPFLVVMPPAVKKGCGWHETICSYNNAHPDNKLEPFMLESFDRFTNILAHPKTRAQFRKLFPKDGIIVIDEVHNYKNPTSKRSKKMQLVGDFYRIGLTATPFTNDLIYDLCSYLVLADFYSSKTNFMNTTGLSKFVDDNYQLMVYTDEGTVNTTIWPEYLTIRDQFADVLFSPKVDVVDSEFPTLTTTTITLDSDPELDDDLHSIVVAYKKRIFENAIDVSNATMTRICTANPRLDMCEQLVGGEGVKQPLIFFYHTEVRDALLSRFPQAQIMDGSHSIAKIDKEKLDVPILIQYKSGSEGVEFKNSNTTIFYENQYSYIALKQAIGRNVRRGQTEPVHHYMLVSQTAFDQEVFNKLSQKEEINEAELETIVERTMLKQTKW